MPWQGLCISPDEDGIGYFVQILQVQLGAWSSSEI